MSEEIITSAGVSQNRVWGVLGATSASDVLESCRQQRLTGEVLFHIGDDVAVVELRAGCVERAEVHGKTGRAAMTTIEALCDGTFEVVQRLPDLGGTLGTAAEFRGEIAEVSLIEVMRHVEAHALSVTLTVVHEFDRGVIRYRQGDIVEVEINGVSDLDRIGDILGFPVGKYRVLASPLELAVPARPAPRRLPTEPFHVAHVRGLVVDDDATAPHDARDGWSEARPPRPRGVAERLGRRAAPTLRVLHRHAQEALTRLAVLLDALDGA